MATIVHIDCNTFFASCEIATRPQLTGKPVVVANCNEAGGGIILALNAQAKAIGLHRGQPVFQVKNLLQQHHVELCPVDHKKYRRISHQIMQTVLDQAIILQFQQYSIDEFFGSLPVDDENEIRHYVQMVKDAITAHTGIPVSCGCACTYTLAKIATHYAKQYAGYHGICILPASQREKALKLLPVNEVWGIGRSLRKKMPALHITTAWDYATKDKPTIQQYFGTQGLRTWKELNGTPAINLNRPSTQQSIMQSRTFTYMLSSLPDLQQQVSTFCSDCCKKLRNQKSTCRQVTVFIATNRHRTDLPQYHNATTAKLSSPSCDTTLITKTALQLVNQLFKTGYQYKQAGVILADITIGENRQLDLFEQDNCRKKNALMHTIDAINAKFGDHTIRLAIQNTPEKYNTDIISFYEENNN